MSHPLRILALDLATTSGWALSHRGVVTSGVRVLPSDPVKRVQDAESWLAYLVGKADRVFVERAGFQHQNARVVAAQLLAELKKACAVAGVELVEVSPKEWKKHATGNGNASKDEVLVAINTRHGLALESHDEADARALLDYVLEAVG